MAQQTCSTPRHSSDHCSSSPSPTPRSRTPSHTVLTLLAFLCADTVCAANPLSYRCPDFLCPPSISPLPTHPQASTSSQSKLEKRHRRQHHIRRKSSQYSSRDVPTKYQPGDDGRWRPAPNWSLHGQSATCAHDSSSSVSAVPDPNADQTGDFSATGGKPLQEDDTLGASNTSMSSMPNAPTDLPHGWTSQSGPTRSPFYSVQVIVVFSLTLAALITFLISFCAVRRIKRRRKNKGSGKPSQDQLTDEFGGEEDPVVARSIKKKKKVWARSTAHWKTNARMAMKRRRGRGTPTSAVEMPSADNPDSDPLDHEPLHTDTSGTTPSSPAPLSNNDDRPATTLVVSAGTLPPTPTSPTPILLQAPPAYRTRRSASPLPDEYDQSGSSTSEELCINEEKMAEAHGSSSDYPRDVREYPQHSGHIATDDKALLERMAASASTPDCYSTIESSQPRAPPWVDDSPFELFNEKSFDRPPDDSAVHCLPSPPPMSQVDISRYVSEENDAFLQLPGGVPSAPPEADAVIIVASAPMIGDLQDDDNALVAPS